MGSALVLSGTFAAGCSHLSWLFSSLWRDAVYNGPIRALIESLTHQPLAAANEGIQGITASITKFDFWMWLCQLWALVRVFRKCDRMREENHVHIVWLCSVYAQDKLLWGTCSHVAVQPGSWGSPCSWRWKEHSGPAVFSISTHLLSINLAILSVVVSNTFGQNFPQVSHYPHPISHQILGISTFKYVLSPSLPFFTSGISIVQALIRPLEMVSDQ